MKALVIVGHGSHLNAESSAPVYAHAAAIRATGAFDEVRECFWKEEPSMREVFDLVEKARHAHWLNPEPRHLWGSGDSAVPRYSDVITMHECRSAKQLAAVIDQLLPV